VPSSSVSSLRVAAGVATVNSLANFFFMSGD
jgi:hypothetical protein